jgi:RloB-like protein
MGKVNPKVVPSRRFTRRSGFRDASLIVIACEGSSTEPAYLGEVVRTFVPMPSRVHVEVLEREDGMSAPEHVIGSLDKFRKQFSLALGDELWALIDYDRWGEEKLSTIAALAVQKKYFLAVSRPCFEFWLLLHYRSPGDLTSSEAADILAKGCDAAKSILKNAAGGYTKRLTNAASYMPLVDDAISRAEGLDTNPGSRWPESLGSRVYRTVRSILKFRQESL